MILMCFFFFFKQKTAYEMRISDWSSDVCSSDLKALITGCSIDSVMRASVLGNIGQQFHPEIRDDQHCHKPGSDERKAHDPEQIAGKLRYARWREPDRYKTDNRHQRTRKHGSCRCSPGCRCCCDAIHEIGRAHV